MAPKFKKENAMTFFIKLSSVSPTNCVTVGSSCW